VEVQEKQNLQQIADDVKYLAHLKQKPVSVTRKVAEALGVAASVAGVAALILQLLQKWECKMTTGMFVSVVVAAAGFILYAVCRIIDRYVEGR
jgi:hypothetical protein